MLRMATMTYRAIARELGFTDEFRFSRRSRSTFGVDLIPVLSALTDWGERHLGPGASPEIIYRHSGCGGRVTATLQCECGERADHHRRLVAEVNR